MTTTLSDAIIRGTALAPESAVYVCPSFPPVSLPGSCPLGAAYLGSLRDNEIAPFWIFVRALSRDSLCQYMHKNLMRVFPQLGLTVRQWPRLAEYLEHELPGLLPRLRAGQTVYRREIHVSLWRVVTGLYGFGWEKARIAELLGRNGL